MTPKELPYKDREITIRDRETVKLSELTKEERDIFFAGVEEGAGVLNFRDILFICAFIIILLALLIFKP